MKMLKTIKLIRKLLVLLLIVTLSMPILTISAEAKSDFEIWEGLLVAYHGKSSSVRIPNSVRYISKGAFKNCKKLKNVTIGKNTAISGITDESDYPNGELPSGDYIIKAGDME